MSRDVRVFVRAILLLLAIDSGAYSISNPGFNLWADILCALAVYTFVQLGSPNHND